MRWGPRGNLDGSPTACHTGCSSKSLHPCKCWYLFVTVVGVRSFVQADSTVKVYGDHLIRSGFPSLWWLGAIRLGRSQSLIISLTSSLKSMVQSQRVGFGEPHKPVFL